jgi:hypothetical protein
MMTRATVDGQRVTVWQSTELPARPLWYWDMPFPGRHSTKGFARLADCIADAQTVLGPDIAITRHSGETAAG